MRLFAIGVFVLACTPFICGAQGGPPMLTDDPGTPGGGNWEINAGYTLHRAHRERLDTFPQIDVNYGLGERIQLKVETGWLFIDERDGRGRRSALDDALLGAKWRFLDGEQVGADVSIYPQLELQNPDHAVARGIAAPGPNLFLPVEAVVRLGPFRLVGELGYQWLRKEHDQWIAGLLAGYEPIQGLELLGEVRSFSHALLNGGDIIVAAGARKAIGKRLKLLASAGTGVNNGSERTRFVGYLGVQWLLGARMDQETASEAAGR